MDLSPEVWVAILQYYKQYSDVCHFTGVLLLEEHKLSPLAKVLPNASPSLQNESNTEFSAPGNIPRGKHPQQSDIP